MPPPQAEHTRPQAVQLRLSSLRFVSQPLTARRSQSPKPAAQLSAHIPATHVGVEFGRAGHAIPHDPQLATVSRRLASQPFAGSLSQFPKPWLHAMNEHAPATHMDVALENAQLFPQRPQWRLLVVSAVSQPVAAMPSQSA